MRQDGRDEIAGADAAIGAVGDGLDVERRDQLRQRLGREAHHGAPGGIEARREDVGQAGGDGAARGRLEFLGGGHGLDPGDVGAAFGQARAPAR